MKNQGFSIFIVSFALTYILFAIIVPIHIYFDFGDFLFLPKSIFILFSAYFLEQKIIWSLLFIVVSFFITLISLNVFFHKFKKSTTKYGYAKFAKKRNIKKLGLNFKKGIILGKAFGKLIKMNEPLSVLVLAPPGVGKTSGLIIPTLLTCKNSVIIHDPKGELYDKTSKERGKFSKILVFDPATDKGCIFNPFSQALLPRDHNMIRGYILNIANLLFKPATKDSDPYFVNSAKSAFIFFAEWLIWKSGNTSFPEVRYKLLENPKVDNTIRTMMTEEGLPPQIITDGNGVLIAAGSDRQWAGVIGSLKENIEIFADPYIEKSTKGESDFTGDNFRKENISLYLKVRDKDAERIAPLIAILAETIGTELISKEPSKTDNNVTFVLDEFVRLGRMEIIKKLPAISRSYKVNIIFVAQDYGQIIEKYDKETLSIFTTNCAYKVIYQQNNKDTANEISALIGNKTDNRVSSSKSINSSKASKGNTGTSKSSSLEGIPLVSNQDILNLNKQYCYIISQGHSSLPIKAKIPFYFKESDLKKLSK